MRIHALHENVRAHNEYITVKPFVGTNANRLEAIDLLLLKILTKLIFFPEHSETRQFTHRIYGYAMSSPEGWEVSLLSKDQRLSVRARLKVELG